MEVIPIDSPQLTVSALSGSFTPLHIHVYAGNRNMKKARSLENSLESARCCSLILMLNSVSCTHLFGKLM